MWNFVKRIGNALRELAQPHGTERAVRNLEVGADRLIDRAVERFPALKKIDTLEPPRKERNLLRETVSDMGGKDWIAKIAEQAKRAEPPSYSGPRTRGH